MFLPLPVFVQADGESVIGKPRGQINTRRLPGTNADKVDESVKDC